MYYPIFYNEMKDDFQINYAQIIGYKKTESMPQIFIVRMD